MELSNVFIFAGIFPDSMVYWSAPSGSLAFRYTYQARMLHYDK